MEPVAGAGSGAGTTSSSGAAGGAAQPMSIESYCAVAANRCPTFEEADIPAYEGLCTTDRLIATRQEGCGQIIIASDGGLGENSYVFDAATHELLGIRMTSDSGGGVDVGEAPNCREGRVCSRCGNGDDCEDACSISELERWQRAPRFDQLSVQPCAGLPEAERFTLATGCGRVTLRSDRSSTVFDAVSHELLSTSRWDAWAQVSHCAGTWGEVELGLCTKETVCSLCSDEPTACSL